MNNDNHNNNINYIKSPPLRPVFKSSIWKNWAQRPGIISLDGNINLEKTFNCHQSAKTCPFKRAWRSEDKQRFWDLRHAI